MAQGALAPLCCLVQPGAHTCGEALKPLAQALQQAWLGGRRTCMAQGALAPLCCLVQPRARVRARARALRAGVRLGVIVVRVQGVQRAVVAAVADAAVRHDHR